jgi:hypothetical protein
MIVDIALPQERGKLAFEMVSKTVGRFQGNKLKDKMDWKAIDGAGVERDVTDPVRIALWENIAQGPWHPDPVVPYETLTSSSVGGEYLVGDVVGTYIYPPLPMKNVGYWDATNLGTEVGGGEIGHSHMAFRVTVENDSTFDPNMARLKGTMSYLGAIAGGDNAAPEAIWTPLKEREVEYEETTTSPGECSTVSPPYPIYDVAGRIQAAPGPGGTIPRRRQLAG